ncbi:MAG: ABC transporter substrate-binding protein, partial [bacterium]
VLNTYRYIKLFFFVSYLAFSVIGFTRETGEKLPRVISLSPHITETIYKIGAGSALVGRTDFCSYPAAAAGVESVGGYLNIDFEKIVQLEPDLIFQFPNPENRRKLESLGFKVVDIPNETVAEILDGILRVGSNLKQLTQAQRLCDQIKDTLKLVTNEGVHRNDSISAILVVGRQRGSLANIYLAGGDTYLSEIWNVCGGINAFQEVDMRYFPVNEEDLLKRRVEAILEFHPAWSPMTEEIINQKKDWGLLNQMAAVQNNKIFIFTERYFVIPGPRITQVAIKFSEIFKTYRAK